MGFCKAANEHRGDRCVFGGRLEVKGNFKPADYLAARLPCSMVGFPRPGTKFNPSNDLFLGANWAAYSDDIKSIGGFDTRFGPGSRYNATGQESEAMKKLRSAGAEFVLVDSAVVWHAVEPERYCDEFVASRMYRSGVQAGLHAQINTSRVTWKALTLYYLKRIAFPISARAFRMVRADGLAAKLQFSASYAHGFINGCMAKLEA